jgi:hypothetical protein
MRFFVTLLFWGFMLLGMRWVLGLGSDAEEIRRYRFAIGQYFIYPYRPVGVASIVIGVIGTGVMSLT